VSDRFNDKHLLWWVLKAIQAGQVEHDLVSEAMWKNIGAPEWVLPAMREKFYESNHTDNFTSTTIEMAMIIAPAITNSP
jgi:hypothetical protein